MGLLSRLAGFVWQATKSIVHKAWHHVVRPAIHAVARWAGFAPERAERATASVEAGAARLVTVLETDMGSLLRDALDAAQLRFERWAVQHLGVLGALLVSAIERLEELVGLRRPAPAPERVVVDRAFDQDRDR